MRRFRITIVTFCLAFIVSPIQNSFSEEISQTTSYPYPRYRALHYNGAHAETPAFRGRRLKVQLEEMAEFLDQDLLVALYNEIWGGGLWTDAQTAYAELGKKKNLNVATGGAMSGLMVFSKFKTDKVEFIPFRNNTLRRNFGILLVWTKVPEWGQGRVCFVCTQVNFSSPFKVPAKVAEDPERLQRAIKKATEIQMNQLRQLAWVLKYKVEPRAQFVVLGMDANVGPNLVFPSHTHFDPKTTIWNEFMAMMPPGYTWAVDQLPPEAATWDNQNPLVSTPSTLLRVFGPPLGLTSSNGDWGYGNAVLDHLGVSWNLELQRPKVIIERPTVPLDGLAQGLRRFAHPKNPEHTNASDHYGCIAEVGPRMTPQILGKPGSAPPTPQ